MRGPARGAPGASIGPVQLPACGSRGTVNARRVDEHGGDVRVPLFRPDDGGCSSGEEEIDPLGQLLQSSLPEPVAQEVHQ
eukprot:8071499-Lingulodinium_polyedra.AAC.1